MNAIGCACLQGAKYVFHFLVTSKEGAWDLPAYEFPRERFLEYTSSWVKDKFKALTSAGIEVMKSYPALFTYEGADKPTRVGYIRHIRATTRAVVAEYQFEDRISEFPFSKLADYKTLLHIDDSWELGRTHWALKEKDLFEALVAAGLADTFFANEGGGQPGRVEEMRFKVALSFPGEKRPYVSALVAALKKRLPKGSVFYDRDFTAQLARPNLDTLLQRIYLQNSDLVVVFLCADYEKKKWCGIEWRAIRGILNNRDDNSLMFMKFDEVDLPGVFSHDGYVDLTAFEPQEAADMIIERVRLNDQDATDVLAFLTW